MKALEQQLSKSYWLASTPSDSYPALDDDITVDVAIVGGGMVGISSAYTLTKAGFKVAVVEADRMVQGTTGHTTAKITSQHSLIYNKLQTKMGKEKAQQYAEANETAIHEISTIIRQNSIDCDFSEQNAYVYTQQDKYMDQIREEVRTASALGIPASYLTEIPLPIPVKAAMRFAKQAQFHPRKYLLTLAKYITDNGGLVFEKTRVLDIEQNTLCRLITNKGTTVSASKVIIASHYPCYEAHGLYFARIYPERSYVLAIKAKEKFPGGMYISAEDPTRSLRAQTNGEEDLILVGGEHHKTGQGEDMLNHYRNLQLFAEQVFTVENIPYRWSTQDYTTMDEVPYIGYLTSATPNILVATGFYKWGMTTSTVAALIFRDLLLHGESRWADVYNPSRFTPTASAKNFIKENVDVAKQLISGKIFPVADHLDLKQGEGKVVKVQGQRVGAFRDFDDELYLVDTTCTHLGCELQWNTAEKSWDCPCHGSRFTYAGEIITGPALKALPCYQSETLGSGTTR